MGPCERFEDLWLDYLYGVCEAEEQRALEAHLPLCPTCQAALEEARACQARLAQAARVIVTVPEFGQPHAPDTPDEAGPTSAPAIPLPAAASLPEAPPTTLPMTPQLKRSLRRRLWPAWAAAAAVLVAALGGNTWYRQGLAARDDAVAQTKRAVTALENQLAAVDQEAAAAQAFKRQQVEADALRVQVIGPAATQAGAPFSARVTTHGLGDAPEKAQLDVRLVNAATGEVLHRRQVESHGATDVALPGGWRAERVRLEVLAQRSERSAPVALQEELKVPPAAKVVHLALNKSIFQPGEVLFFRALMLERFSLKPATPAFPLRFQLLDAAGRAMLEVSGMTGSDGVVSGGFALVPELPPGNYTVQVSADAGQVAPQRRLVEIVSHLGEVDIRPDRGIYHAGDRMNLDIALRGADGKPLPNQPFVVRPNFGGPPSEQAAAKAIAGSTDKEGRARIQVPVPPKLTSPRISVDVEAPGLGGGFRGNFGGGFGGGIGGGVDNMGAARNLAPPAKKRATAEGKAGTAKADAKDQTLQAEAFARDGAWATRSFAAVPSRLMIDFFPEGGNLVAGIPQRVYFRVRSPSGEPVAPDGNVLVRSSKGVIYNSERPQAAGSFLLTPDPKETYIVQIAGTTGASDIRDPFRGLGIQAEGVVLHAARSVLAALEPVKVELRRRGGAERPMLLVAQCRGQMVMQKLIENAGATTAVALDLPAEAFGVITLTAYDVGDGRLEPRAERLVYRAPARRLDVQAVVEGKQAGQKGRLLIQAHDEAGKGIDARGLAVIVEDKYRAESSERSLTAHFLIASELDAGDGAPLGDDAAIDLALGIRGWRRFVPAGADPTLLARTMNKGVNGVNDDQEASSSVALFARANVPAAELRRQVAQRVQVAAAAVQRDAEQARAKLEAQRGDLAAALSAAQQARHEYERLPSQYLRLGAGVLAVSAFAAGCLLLVFGLVRSLLAKRSATPAYASALGALAVCLALYLAWGSFVEVQAPPGVGDQRIAEGPKTRPQAPAEERQADRAKPAAPGKSKAEGTTMAAEPAPRAEIPAPPPAIAKSAAGKGAATGAPPMPAAPRPTGDDRKTTERSDAAALPVQPIQRLPVDAARGGGLDGLSAGAAGPGAALRDAPPGPIGYMANPVLNERFAEALRFQTPRADFSEREAKKEMAKMLTVPPPSAPGFMPAPPPGNPAQQLAASAALRNATLHESPLVAREFSHRRNAGPDLQPTLVWHPALGLPDGAARIGFDFPALPSTYRVLIFTHTDDGRLGFYEGRMTTTRDGK